MPLCLKSIINTLRRSCKVIVIILGAIASLIVILQYFQGKSTIEYNEPLIPLVDLDFNEFRKFLDENIGGQ